MDVTFPQMGDSVSEGTVIEWRKAVGDPVEADETLVEISTDKVDAEVPSPVAGTVAEILVEPDETVAVGAVLCRIAAGARAAPRPGSSPRPRPARSAPPPRPPARATARANATPWRPAWRAHTGIDLGGSRAAARAGA